MSWLRVDPNSSGQLIRLDDDARRWRGDAPDTVRYVALEEPHDD